MEFFYPTVDISFRARIDTFVTLKTISGNIHGSIRWQFNGRRALSGAGTAAANTVFPFPVQGKKRQDREQRKNSSHRAQKTAEKAFFKKHTNQN